jgi:hypothetical protein
MCVFSEGALVRLKGGVLNMKKLISIAVTVILCISISIPAKAVETSTLDLDSVSQDAADIWVSLREEGGITADEEGVLTVDKENSCVGRVGYTRFLEAIALYNELIVDEIIEVDAQTGELTNCLANQLPERTIMEGEQHIQSQIQSDVPIVVPKPKRSLVSHRCSYPNLNLIEMCGNNYKELNRIYSLNKIIEAVNPSGIHTAWLTTAIYWVNKVRENGDWDYKVQPNFNPWYKTFCSYYNGAYHHITSEYIGNFNYGYTGSLLFSLDILHAGSSAVSGFNPADKEDWPAIDAGFKKATT